MRFFDKIKDAADQAKKALDDAGVLDDVADALEEVTSGSDASSSSEHSQSAPPEIPEGIVDPATLLSVADVEAVTGRKLDNQYPFRDEEWIGTIFTSSEGNEHGSFELRVAKAPDYEKYDPDAMWEFLTTEVDPQIPVSGVSEGAFRSSDDIIYFRVGGQVLHTVANLGEREAEQALELARLAAARLRQ